MVSRQLKLFMRVMPDLVEGYYDGRCISSVALEDNNGLRNRTLFPVFSKLVHVGILSSQAGGNNWGYIFFIDPKVLTLYDVMNAIKPLPYPTCSLKLHHDDDNCVACAIMTKGLNGIAAKLKKVTIYELYELAKAKRRVECEKRGLKR